MKIINKPTTTPVVKQDIPEPKERVPARFDTFFKAIPPASASLITFMFFIGSPGRVYVVRLGSMNRYTDGVHFSLGEDARPKLEALGWINIELIKDKTLKMELV